MVGVYEILLHSFEIWVVSKESKRGDGPRVIFCEIRIFESDETVFFVVGFIEADFGEVIVIFEEEEGEDRGGNYNDNLED